MVQMIIKLSNLKKKKNVAIPHKDLLTDSSNEPNKLSLEITTKHLFVVAPHYYHLEEAVLKMANSKQLFRPMRIIVNQSLPILLLIRTYVKTVKTVPVSSSLSQTYACVGAPIIALRGDSSSEC